MTRIEVQAHHRSPDTFVDQMGKEYSRSEVQEVGWIDGGPAALIAIASFLLGGSMIGKGVSFGYTLIVLAPVFWMGRRRHVVDKDAASVAGEVDRNHAEIPKDAPAPPPSEPCTPQPSQDAKGRAATEPFAQATKFAAFIGENAPSPVDVYDESLLPYPKEEIEETIMRLVIGSKLIGEEAYGMSWFSMLDSLAQYQNGVGEKPLGVGQLLSAHNTEDSISLDSISQLAQRFVEASLPSEIEARVEQDRARYREFMRSVFGEKWERMMVETQELASELLKTLPGMQGSS